MRNFSSSIFFFGLQSLVIILSHAITMELYKIYLPWVSNLFPPPHCERTFLDGCPKEILSWETFSWTPQSTGGGLNYSPTVKSRCELHVCSIISWFCTFSFSCSFCHLYTKICTYADIHYLTHKTSSLSLHASWESR